ncbi:hypothetical protein Tco_0339262 [Tanacetum coccineum]
MFEDNTYKTYEVQNDLYEALQKSVELDYSNQRLADQEEARKKKRKRRESPRTPPGSPLTQPPPPPPPAGASGAPGTSVASRSSQLPLPPPPPSTGTSGSAQQQGSKAPSSSKTTASASQSMAWTTSDTQYESADISRAQELSPTDYLMQDDAIPEEQVHLSDDEDFENDHQPKAGSRKDWWKSLSEEEIPATPELAWTIPSSNKSDVVNNWASALATTYEPPAGNSLLAKIGDMTTFMNCYCQKIKLTRRIQKELKSESMSTDHCLLVVLQVMLLFKLNSSSIRLGVLEIWQQGKQSRTIDFQDEGCQVKAYSRYWYDYLSEIVLRRANFHEYTIAEKDFKNLYPNDFEDLNLLLLQGHLDHLPDFQLGIESYQIQLNLTKPGWDATGYEFKHDYTIIESPRAVVFPVDKNDRKIMRFNEIYKFSDGTLTRILDALDYRVNEFKWIFNSLVHSLRALSTLRRSGLRMASTAAKPCQGDSLEFYLESPTVAADGKRHVNSQPPCSHLIFLIKDIMITERPTTQLPQL